MTLDIFLELDHRYFLKFGVVLDVHVRLSMTAEFLKKKKIGPKNGVSKAKVKLFEIIEKFRH